MKKSELELIVFSELDLLTGLVYGEARNQSFKGKVAVAMTVSNRVKHPGHWSWGYNWRDVILKKYQFSCYNKDDPNYKKIISMHKENTDVWLECGVVAEYVYLDKLQSYLPAVPTHYHTKSIKPSWVNDLRYLYTIEDHVFYTCF